MKKIIDYIVMFRPIIYTLAFFTLFIFILVSAKNNHSIYEVTIVDLYQDNGILGKTRYTIVYNSRCIKKGGIWSDGYLGESSFGKQKVDGSTYRCYHKGQKFRNETGLIYF